MDGYAMYVEIVPEDVMGCVIMYIGVEDLLGMCRISSVFRNRYCRNGDNRVWNFMIDRDITDFDESFGRYRERTIDYHRGDYVKGYDFSKYFKNISLKDQYFSIYLDNDIDIMINHITYMIQRRFTSNAGVKIKPIVLNWINKYAHVLTQIQLNILFLEVTLYPIKEIFDLLLEVGANNYRDAAVNIFIDSYASPINLSMLDKLYQLDNTIFNGIYDEFDHIIQIYDIMTVILNRYGMSTKDKNYVLHKLLDEIKPDYNIANTIIRNGVTNLNELLTYHTQENNHKTIKFLSNHINPKPSLLNLITSKLYPH